MGEQFKCSKCREPIAPSQANAVIVNDRLYRGGSTYEFQLCEACKMALVNWMNKQEVENE